MDTFTIEPCHPLHRRPKGVNQCRNLSPILALILSERINSGALEPGQKLPPEAQIMAEYGVNRAEYGRRLQHEQSAIYQSIADGDPVAAKAAMHLYLSSIRERLRRANFP